MYMYNTYMYDMQSASKRGGGLGCPAELFAKYSLQTVDATVTTPNKIARHILHHINNK